MAIDQQFKISVTPERKSLDLADIPDNAVSV
jgi:hypothetical protein